MQHCPNCQSQPDARLGGLFSYGPDQDAMWLRAVGMAAEVMRGKPVGEIPSTSRRASA